MKIKKIILKNIFVQHLLAFITSIYIYFVRFTSKIIIENSSSPNYFWKNNKPFILAFWHSQLMMISFSWKISHKINILASGHSDGRFGSIVGKYFNLKNIQTSNKNKDISLRPIFKLLKENKYIGITPDGPRGPKEKVSEGIIKIAKTAKVPIITVGFCSSNNLKLNSWDSFLVTLPFSKCSFVWGEPIQISQDLNEKKIQYFQELIQNNINQCIEKAKKNLR